MFDGTNLTLISDVNQDTYPLLTQVSGEINRSKLTHQERDPDLPKFGDHTTWPSSWNRKK